MESVATNTLPKRNVRDKLNTLSGDIYHNVRNNVGFYKKRIGIALCVVLFIMLGLSLLAYCADYDSATGLTKFCLNMVDDIFGADTLEGVKNILHVEYAGGSGSAFRITNASGAVRVISIGTGINKVYKIFQGIGMYLVILYFGVGMFEEFSFQQVFVEKLFKKAIYLIVAVVCVTNAQLIIYAIANVGTTLIDKTFDAISSSSSSMVLGTLKQIIYDDTTTSADAGFWDYLGAMISDFIMQISYILQLFIPWLISLICFVMVQFACWSRFIEIILMGIISPIGFADIAKGHLEHSNAMKLVKNAIALAATGAVILIICWLCNKIQLSIIYASALNRDNFADAIWQCVLLSIVQMGMVQRASELTKSAMGMA